MPDAKTVAMGWPDSITVSGLGMSAIEGWFDFDVDVSADVQASRLMLSNVVWLTGNGSGWPEKMISFPCSKLSDGRLLRV